MRLPRIPAMTTWFCVRCAREGRRNVYVDRSKTRCPYGHRRQT